VEAVLAQRLVRRICDSCRRPVELTAEQRSALGDAASELGEVWEGEGCEQCRGTGYSGRTGIYELLVMEPEIREAVLGDTTISAGRLQVLAREAGMKLLREDGLRVVAEGLTTVEEVLRVASA
jgi:type II secretory ATPase GspE/PulE/Tfp pilus assembly ATPase PilB-like protein